VKEKPALKQRALIGEPLYLDPCEVARLQKVQPPFEIPRRNYGSPESGLIALQLLGGRLHRRHEA